jgi:hypothetical protein
MNTRASLLRRKTRLEVAKKAPPIPPKTPATNDFPLSDVITLPPSKLPSPWLYDTECLLKDVDRIRELIWLIPVHNDTYSPINVAAASAWDLREKLQFLIALREGGQQRWRAKNSTELQNQDAGRQTETRTVKARRRDAARVA